MCTSESVGIVLLDEKGRTFPLLRKIRTLRRAEKRPSGECGYGPGNSKSWTPLCDPKKEDVKKAQRKLAIKQQSGKGKATPENLN